jgi:hypothetical protein
VQTVASAVYFLADLKVGTTFIEPMMSIWTDEDIRVAEEELTSHPPDCIVTGGEGYLLTPRMFSAFPWTTVSSIPEVPGGIVACR